jgi:hypothetical protein
LDGLYLAWPILAVLILVKATLGLFVGLLEHWTPSASVYFAFVTGLTIGYGDLAPTTALSRFLAIVIGLTGIVFSGLVVGLAVRALQIAAPYTRGQGRQ